MIMVTSSIGLRIGLNLHEDGEPTNWITDSGLQAERWFVQYTAAIYYTVVTFTTVGYGDYLPQTNEEFAFIMALEFLGIAAFSLVSGSILEIFTTSPDSMDKYEVKLEEGDRWMISLDDANKGKALSDKLYKKIKQYIQASFSKDFNMIIEDYPFFDQIKPRLRYKICMEIFYDFYDDFKYLFKQDYFKADKEFVSRFLSQLYCRIYIPNQKMIKKGEKFSELHMVYSGTVSLRISKAFNEFFVLPSGSMIGDF